MTRYVNLAFACCTVLGACGDDGDDGVVSPDTTDTAGERDSSSPELAVTDSGADTGPDASSPDPGLVITTSGSLAGVVEADHRVFRGIPFAAPPVDGLRWRSPQPVTPWTATRDASKFGPSCPQAADLFDRVPAGHSEDCLYLNVWTPNPAPAGAPVMVFWHGGGFVFGSGSVSTYHGQNLARRGVVVVTVNYRLGALGYMAHPALSEEDPGHPASGNYGLMDQVASLEWVRDNIAAFGGDPENVTVFGESAGSISVCIALATPRAEGLFHRAIMQSGVCGGQAELAVAQEQGVTLSNALGCGVDPDELGCLRSHSADAVNQALKVSDALFLGDGVTWGPIVDGVVVPEPPLTAFLTGDVANVPLILGSNADEGTIFIELAGGMTSESLEALLSAWFPSGAEQILTEYPRSDFATVEEQAAEIIGDGLFNCTTHTVARALAAFSVPTWVYHFAHPVDVEILPGLGAFHAAELLFVFGNDLAGRTVTEAEEPLAEAIQAYWTDFARSGDPNGTTGSSWPAFTATGQEYLVLDDVIGTAANLKADRCAFWQTLYLSL